MIPSIESVVLLAFIMGIISAASLPLGALSAFVWKPDQRVVAGLMAFGAGALLAALTLDLAGPAVEHGHFVALAVGSVLGGVLFLALDSLVNNYGGYRRKISTTLHHTSLKNRQWLHQTFSHLGRTDLFSTLGDEEIARLAQSIQIRFYAQGSLVFDRLDEAQSLFVLLHGSISLQEPNAPDEATTLKQGDAFGRAAVLGGCPYAMRAKTLTPCWVAAIPKESLSHLMLESQVFAKQMEGWLLGQEMVDYLKNKQHLSEGRILQWQEEVKESLQGECILPEASPPERRLEAFVDFAPLIERISWLEDLAQEEAEALGSVLVYKRFVQGETLFSQGDPADHLFLIESGEVVVSDMEDKSRLHKQDKGDGVGGRAFVCGLRHTVSAKVSVEGGGWVLDRSGLERLLSRDASFRLRLVFHLREAALASYLQKSYSLNQGQILAWLHSAEKSVKEGKLPPSLLEQGVESTNPHGASLAIWLGILLDGIPESLVIGANMIHSSISVSLIAGLFLSNYPEALSSSRGMLHEGMSKKRVLLMWSSIMIFTGIGAALGNLTMQAAEPHWFAFIEGVAAGAMLTMIAQTMLPEAYSKGGSITGLATLFGFLCTISLKGAGH